MINSNLNPLAFVKAVVGAVVPFVTLWLSQGTVDWSNVIAALVGAVLVYVFPNVQVGGSRTSVE